MATAARNLIHSTLKKSRQRGVQTNRKSVLGNAADGSTKSTARRRQPPHVEQPLDPAAAARAAGLRYVTDSQPGLLRKPHGKAFRYTYADGQPVRDEETLKRIRSLVIPPAWQDVWIAPVANGHLQATGRDARGRKQSRYHPHWREARDETKYEHMMHFGDALPAIRARVDHDLARHGLPREKVLAAIIRLMETTSIRVGNEEYARQNKSYGLTTMRDRHVRFKGGTVTFDFRGKSGVHHVIDVEDRRLARIVRDCQHIPGQELFQYLDHEGHRHTIESADVNAYLHEITGQHFTAKDFRTWAGTVMCCMLLREFEPFDTGSQAKKNVVAAIKAVSERLGNTPSVCRKCYVHPAVLDKYLSGNMLASLEHELEEEVDRRDQALRSEERHMLQLLGHTTA